MTASLPPGSLQEMGTAQMSSMGPVPSNGQLSLEQLATSINQESSVIVAHLNNVLAALIGPTPSPTVQPEAPITNNLRDTLNQAISNQTQAVNLLHEIANVIRTP